MDKNAVVRVVIVKSKPCQASEMPNDGGGKKRQTFLWRQDTANADARKTRRKPTHFPGGFRGKEICSLPQALKRKTLQNKAANAIRNQ